MRHPCLAALLLLCLAGPAAFGGAVLDVEDDTANDCYIITAYDTIDTEYEYWEVKVDKASGSLYSFKDLTDDGDGQGDHASYLGPNEGYYRNCSLIHLDGRGGNVLTQQGALVDLDDRLSFETAQDNSSFTITYTEDAQSTDFFHDDYGDDLDPGDLLTTIAFVIRPPTEEGTIWDWSIECENVSGGTMTSKVWAQQFINTYLEGDISKTFDYDTTRTDGEWDAEDPESYMRWTVDGASGMGLTVDREIVIDYQDGLSGESAGSTVTTGTWADRDYGRYASAFSYSGTDLPNGQTRTDAGQVLINIASLPEYATLGYEYGATNTTYHYRPLTITAASDEDDIWEMTLWVPQDGYDQTGHQYWLAGEITSFKDLQHGGTAFEYSPEADSYTSYGLMRMSSMAGDFDDTDGQTDGYYEFTKTYELATDVTAVLTVRINAPLIGGSDFQSIIEGTYTIANDSGSSYDLWYTGSTAGTGCLCLEEESYTGWSIVNPTDSTGKPNAHLTDSTDGHQLYEIYDWYGSTVTSAIPGFYAKMVVKDNATTSALNMRPGLTFELRADDADLYYTDAANTMYGSTTVSSTTGVRCRLNSQPGIFGSGVTLPDGESITLEWEGIISTWPTYIPPVADAGEDFEVVDSDGGGDEGVTLDGSDSFDPDGSIVSYVWYNGETQVATGETAYLTLDVDLYTFTLVVTDDDGETDSDTVVVSVRGKDGYTYYVDYDGGSDSNNGRSTALPFQHCPGDTNATGTAASTSLTQGDKVIFKGGVVYRGEINCNWSGVSGNPIIYDGNSEASFGTGRAVVDGSEVLTGWTQCTSANDCDGNPNYANIYWTYLPAGVTAFSANLYEDDELIWLAQDPNQPDPFWYDEIDNYVTFDSATDTTIVDASYFTQTESTYWDGSTYVLIWAVPNEVFPCLVTGFDPDEDEIAFESLGQTHYSPGKFAMCNSLKILDTAGEYVVREDQTDGNGGCKVYLWPLTSGVSGKTFTVSVRENIFEVSSRSYITIRGFTIQKAASGFGQVGGAGSAIRNSTSSTTRYDIVVTDNVLTMNKSMEKQPVVNLDEVDGCLIQDNEIRENVRSRGCMLSDCVDSSVNDNVLYKNGGTGIAFFGSSYCEMCGNTVTDHKGVHANGLTVYLDSDNILLAGNVVTGGNIAFTSQESDDLTVAYNVLETAEGVYAVAVWNDCAGVDFYNNVVRHTASPGSGISIGSTNNTDIVLKNNIIDGTNALYAGHTCQYNIYTSLMWCQNPQSLGTGEFEADAEDLWVDPDEGDYHLPSDSDAIDAGVDVGFDADIEGTSVPQGDYPDIGAYEYEQE